MKLRLFSAIFALFQLYAMATHSQQIKIVVMDAHHGKPVANESINISLGPWHGADLLASTGKDGTILLSLERNEVSVPLPVGRSCGGLASTKPLSIASIRLSVLPDWYVSCQYSTKLTHDPAWLQANPAERIPSFAVKDILSSGVVATNSCTKFAPTPEPGKLVIFVRKRTFLEGLRS